MQQMLRFVLLVSVLALCVLWGLSALNRAIHATPAHIVFLQQGSGDTGSVAHAEPLTGTTVTVLSSPRLSPQFIDQVLASYHSPAQGLGQTLYDLGRRYGINSDLALAFFGHESTFGTRGEATKTHSLGNLRCVPVPADADDCVDQESGGYASFTTWSRGMEEWYRLMKHLYVEQWRLTTISQIIHVYAPAADGNNESAYIHELLTFLSAWYSGRVRP